MAGDVGFEERPRPLVLRLNELGPFSESLRLPASLFLRRAGVGRFDQLEGGAAPRGVERCLLSASNGDLPDPGVCGGPLDGGLLYELSESELGDRRWSMSRSSKRP